MGKFFPRSVPARKQQINNEKLFLSSFLCLSFTIYSRFPFALYLVATVIICLTNIISVCISRLMTSCRVMSHCSKIPCEVQVLEPVHTSVCQASTLRTSLDKRCDVVAGVCAAYIRSLNAYARLL